MTWDTERLSALIPDVAVGFASSDNLEDGVFQIRMNNLTRDSTWDWSKRRRVVPTARQLKAARVRPGDVIFNATNSPELVGKSGLMPDLDEIAVISNHFMRLRPAEPLDRGYLAHWLRAEFERGVFRARAKAWINQATVSRETLLAMRIPLPPLAEQRRIAAILDEADCLRRQNDRAAAALADLERMLFESLVDVNDLRHTVRLGELVDFLTSGSRGWAKYYTASGAKFLRVQNIRGGEVNLSDIAYVKPPGTAEAKRTRVRAGDVLVSITADLGRTAVIPDDFGDAYISQHLAIVRAPRINPVFLSSFIESSLGRAQLLGMNRGQIKDGLNFDNIRSLRVPVPDISAQRTFEARKRDVQQEALRLERRGDLLDTLFASLQHRAFRGEL